MRKWGVTLLRVIAGALFFGHGAQKLFGWFGGHGLDGTGQAFDSMGLRPGRRNAMMAGAAEAGGGALMIAGAATPLAAASLIGVMGTAAWMVHRPNGVWVAEGGYEYNLVLGAVAFTVVAEGPGRYSVDRCEWGPAWALASLAAGLGGAAFTVRRAQAQMAAAQQDEQAGGAAPAPAEPATATA